MQRAKEKKNRPRAPGRTAAGTSGKKQAGGKKEGSLLTRALENLAASAMDRLHGMNLKKALIENVPYFIIFYIIEKEAWLYRHCTGSSMVEKLMNLFLYFALAFQSFLPSFHPWDIAVGIAGAAGFKAFIWYRQKNAKKFRQGEEYGSARWGTPKDIAPFIDPVFDNNVILTQTEFLTMESRPKNWKYARNKNVVVIGGSGSGKTRFYVKPQLMQANRDSKISYVVTDPKVEVIKVKVEALI